MSLRDMAVQAIDQQEEAERAARRAKLLESKAAQTEACRKWFNDALGVQPDVIEPRLTMFGNCELRGGAKHFFDCPNGCGETQWASLAETCYVEVEDLAFDWYRPSRTEGAHAYIFKGDDDGKLGRWFDHSLQSRILNLSDLGKILRKKA